MNNKTKIIIGVVVAVVVICLIVLLIPKNKKKDNKKEEEETKVVVDATYDLEDIEYETLAISEIELEVRQSESVLRFVITNNGEEVYPEGMMSFDIYDSENKIGKAETFVTEIAAHDEVAVEIVLNEAYSKVTDIKVSNE